MKTGRQGRQGAKVTNRFGTTPQKKKSSERSCFKSLIEIIFLIFWLLFTGFAGYFVGHSTITPDQIPAELQEEALKCPPPPPPKFIPRTTPCAAESPDAESSTTQESNSKKPPSYSLDELKRMWTCSRAVANSTFENRQLLPSDGDLSKTKWKSILAVEPNAFFNKYLTQYPGDTAAVQPVVIFSHR